MMSGLQSKASWTTDGSSDLSTSAVEKEAVGALNGSTPSQRIDKDRHGMDDEAQLEHDLQLTRKSYNNG